MPQLDKFIFFPQFVGVVTMLFLSYYFLLRFVFPAVYGSLKVRATSPILAFEGGNSWTTWLIIHKFIVFKRFSWMTRVGRKSLYDSEMVYGFKVFNSLMRNFNCNFGMDYFFRLSCRKYGEQSFSFWPFFLRGGFSFLLNYFFLSCFFRYFSDKLDRTIFFFRFNVFFFPMLRSKLNYFFRCSGTFLSSCYSKTWTALFNRYYVLSWLVLEEDKFPSLVSQSTLQIIDLYRRS
jgi:hypothetical protein